MRAAQSVATNCSAVPEGRRVERPAGAREFRRRADLSVIREVGDCVPPSGRSDARVIPFGRCCLLYANVRQLRIMHEDIAFELSKQRVVGKFCIRERPSLVPPPTHASHLAPAVTLDGKAADRGAVHGERPRTICVKRPMTTEEEIDELLLNVLLIIWLASRFNIICGRE